MAAENGQLEEVRYIHCLLCNDNKPFKGFLSHIREKHVNYYRYKCTKCAFKSDNEEDSALHSFEKNHHVKFDNANYHEHLAVKIFQDCCREQFVIRHEMEKHENFISEPTKRRRNWNSCSDIQKIQSPKKSKLKTNDTCTSSLLKHEVDLQVISGNQRNSGNTTNSRKCLNDVEKLESGIPTTKILSKAAADDSESYKLSESDNQTLCALGLFSDALENTETTSSDKFLNSNAVNNVVSIDGEVSKSNRNTFDPKRRTVENSSVPLVTTLKLNTTCRKCGKDVGVDYIAKKTHALQFHFTQDDDPEIAELLPATVKACFPYSLSWSDYQCTECGKALGTHGSRRNHVLKEHFYWSAICPLSGCTTVINAVGNLEEHFKLEHNISMSKMPKGLRQKLIKMENDRKNDLHRQLSHCFPCSLPPKRQITSKESACDSKHLPKPSITSVLSSLLHSEPINYAKKKNFTYSSSDTESSSGDDEDGSGIKDEEYYVVNEKECSKNVSDLDSNITCDNFCDHEKRGDVGDKEQPCSTACHSRCFESSE
ncbi:Uncharacterized protein BM_BM13162 [Brugia malayi]|uniref:Bm13162 n=1 Tax=Brugia malayi TaxID=6279 RepID=A0A0J9Y1Q1_BRUMA|nr:Uncharacterized protein BM_BM13162 [Brugia malayi]CDP99730.2 Bm13162 [Brugia malayi]VIO91808.1 Uncharacterized protein BM_BM13162 [Brugia malayi]